MLDRAAVELVEDALDLVADGQGSEEAGGFGHAVLQIAIAPEHVHSDRERAIAELGEGRVVVPRERRERAARRLDELQSLPAASSGGDLGFSADPVDRDLRDGAVAPCGTEE